MAFGEEQIAAILAREHRLEEVRAGLLSENPKLGFVNSIIYANDILTAEDATERVRGGMSPIDALPLVGSYARFQWAVEHLQRRSLFKRLPELWVSSDPDDTRPEYLELWREARARNDGITIIDDKYRPLPTGELIIYRGQVGRKNPGIAWTLDVDIAQRFAKTGGGRSDVRGGVILKARVKAVDVLAYLTKRGESEVIVDPHILSIV